MTADRVPALIALGEALVGAARRAGAEAAEVLAKEQRELSAKVRLGEPELVEEAQSRAVGLRVFRDGRSAIAHTNDTSPAGQEALVAAALELVDLSEPDPLALPPGPGELGRAPGDLELYDPQVEALDARRALELAALAERAARSADPRISNSEGATTRRTASATALVTSGGFAQGQQGTYCALSVQPVAEDAGGKKRAASYWDARRFLAELEAPEEIGRRAAEKTVAKLGARKLASGRLPVVFEPDAGRALLSLFSSAVFGTAIYQRASYLLDKEGERVASPLVTLVDDPLRPRGPASRAFDGEGLPSRRTTVVEAGVLKSYLLDCYSARKLSRASTASASRGVGSRPTVATTNFLLCPGLGGRDEILRGVPRGLLVTSMMGFGFNPVTGDFSRGAEGFLVEGGERVHPVGEITISLDFLELWRGIDAVGADLDDRSSLMVPTFRVREMIVAGT